MRKTVPESTQLNPVNPEMDIRIYFESKITQT